MKDSIDYMMNDVPVCPYCDEKMRDDGDLHEQVSYEQDGETEVECSACNKKFDVVTHLVMNFTTSGSCKVHELKKNCFDSSPYTCQVCASEFYSWVLEGGKYQKLNKDQYNIIGE